MACALAPTVGALVAARLVQGAAAAVMLPSSMALLREAFPDSRERARALGIWAVGGAVAVAVGPLLGGLLTVVDWRLVFLINVPVCAAMLLLLRSVAASPTHPALFDWWGQALSLLGLGALMYGLIEGGALGYGDPAIVGCLALAVVALSCFLAVQRRSRHPMMPLDLFRGSDMRIALLVGFAFMVGNFGSVFVVSLYLQQHLGLSPLLAGLVFLPSAAFGVVGNIVSGTLANRFRPRVPIALGLTTMAVGLLGLLLAAPLDSVIAVSALLVLTGAGGAVAMPPATAVVLASVPPAPSEYRERCVQHLPPGGRRGRHRRLRRAPRRPDGFRRWDADVHARRRSGAPRCRRGSGLHQGRGDERVGRRPASDGRGRTVRCPVASARCAGPPHGARPPDVHPTHGPEVMG
ncbi:MFS transporter [Rathayibacter tanaceti]|uniref:MFS transporter n=1 Tax=Rathayibacter tanaceti TaxID=1671680 RepID=UPI001F5415F7